MYSLSVVKQWQFNIFAVLKDEVYSQVILSHCLHILEYVIIACLYGNQTEEAFFTAIAMQLFETVILHNSV